MDYYDVMLCDVHGHTKVGPCPYCEIARLREVCQERTDDVGRLAEALDMVASPLKIDGENHMAAVKLARAALEEE
jgi:hypothetical protein